MLVHFAHHYGLRGLVGIGFKTQIPPDLTPQVKILHIGAAFFGITGRTFPEISPTAFSAEIARDERCREFRRFFRHYLMRTVCDGSLQMWRFGVGKNSAGEY